MSIRHLRHFVSCYFSSNLVTIYILSFSANERDAINYTQQPMVIKLERAVSIKKKSIEVLRKGLCNILIDVDDLYDIQIILDDEIEQMEHMGEIADGNAEIGGIREGNEGDNHCNNADGGHHGNMNGTENVLPGVLPVDVGIGTNYGGNKVRNNAVAGDANNIGNTVGQVIGNNVNGLADILPNDIVPDVAVAVAGNGDQDDFSGVIKFELNVSAEAFSAQYK